MIVDVIVLSSIAFAVIFLAFWLKLPELRAWIERPKYRFQSNVQSYDKVQKSGSDSGRRSDSR